MTDKQATAAPKGHIRVRVTVTNGTKSTPLAGAAVSLTTSTGTSVANGTSNKSGTWTTGSITPDIYTVSSTFSGFGPPADAGSVATEGSSSQLVTVPAGTSSAPIFDVSLTMVQTYTRAIVTVVDNDNNQRPVSGALVTLQWPTDQWQSSTPTVALAGDSGLTDYVTGAGGKRSAVYTSAQLPTAVPLSSSLGESHVTVSKAGYGSPSPPAPSKVGDTVMPIDLSTPTDVAVTVPLANVWGLVRSHNIKVGGADFFDWYNTTFVPRYTTKPDFLDYCFHTIQDKAQFTYCFDHCDNFWEPLLDVEVFIGLFLIFMNETGGNFLPKGEMGSLKYLFEVKPKVPAGSYNRSPNRLAGDQLLKKGVITEDQVAAWNSTTLYPSPAPGSALEAAARECDFNKFRGRGIIQVTWRDAYVNSVAPTLIAKGIGSGADPMDRLDSLTTAQLDNLVMTDPDLRWVMIKVYLRDRSVSGKVDGLNRQSWWKLGKRVSGGDDYATRFEWRCKELYAALQKEGLTTS